MLCYKRGASAGVILLRLILLCISGISPTFQSKKNKIRKGGGIKGDLLDFQGVIIQKTKVIVDKNEHLFYSE